VVLQPPAPSQSDVLSHCPGKQLYLTPKHTPFLHTSPYEQLSPSLHPVLSGALPLSMQVCAPVLHEVIPTLHAPPGLPVQDTPAVQLMQVPAVLQTMFGPQAVPGAFSVLLLQTIVPVLQLVTPV